MLRTRFILQLILIPFIGAFLNSCLQSETKSEPEMESYLKIDSVQFKVDHASCTRFASISYEREIFDILIDITSAFSQFDTEKDYDSVSMVLKCKVKEGEHSFQDSSELPFMLLNVIEKDKNTMTSHSARHDPAGEFNQLIISKIDMKAKQLDFELTYYYDTHKDLEGPHEIELIMKNVPIDWQK